MLRTVFIMSVLLGCSAPRLPDPTVPSATPDVPLDGGLPSVDAGVHYCALLCDRCGDVLTPDGGSCLQGCEQLVYSLDGEIDPVCVEHAPDCDSAVRCIWEAG